jgi:hypothetical protein
MGSIPLIDQVEMGERVEGEVFLDWDETHPILRHVSVESMFVVGWNELKLPDNAVRLIEGASGPVIAMLHEPRHHYLISAFSIFNEDRTRLNTDWVDNEGFVVFFYNALRYLTGGSSVGQLPSVSPGQAFSVAAKPGASSIKIRRPDGSSDSVPVRGDGLASYGRTDRVGVSQTSTGILGEDARAVNLLDDHESFIVPASEFRISGAAVQTAESVERVNRPMWPYVLALLAGLLLVEWVVYNKRVFI